MILATIAGVLLLVFLLGPRLKLNASLPPRRAPEAADPMALQDWLQQEEADIPELIEGTEAHIQWYNPERPERTPLVFFYIHGFSATWQETAPVTEHLASHFHANVLQGRVAGHGFHDKGMEVPATDWLQSVRDQWDIASQLGDKVVVVATSTGAPLSVWLTQLPEAKDQIHAFLFMAPNFQVRNPAAKLLTWPWAKYWIQLIIGKTHRWEPESEAQGKYWTFEYTTRALMEMQSVVDWFQHQPLSHHQIPLAVMYMRNDPVISPKAAVDSFNAWGAEHKSLMPVEINGDEAQHVFVGNITAPHRTDWVVERFTDFLESLETTE